MAGSKSMRKFLRAVEDNGGSWELSADGHVKVFDAAGTFVAKLRAAGKQVGDAHGTERRVRSQMLARIRREGR